MSFEATQRAVPPAPGHAAPRPPAAVMHPRRLAALPANPLSATRTLMDRMTREHWEIDLLRADLTPEGNGTLVYRINAGGHVLSAVAFSTEPRMVNRTPRIIGSSWDVLGALMEGEPDEERIEQTRREMPKLYAGRAADRTLVWFRANRSLRAFDEVQQALAAGEDPDEERLLEAGYLLRNTGLDGNGTFGTVDFSAYGPDHPLALPYHAQMLSAYMMREISFDLVESLARLRNAGAARLSPELKRRVAVGNGSALGLVLFFMNRPRLVSRWIGLYEESTARVLSLTWPADAPELDLFDDLLGRVIEAKEADSTPYRLFPSGPLVAQELRHLRRELRARRARARAEGTGLALGAVESACSAGTGPEAVELFRSTALELDRGAWEPRLGELVVDESMRPDPTWPVARLRDTVHATVPWTADYPRNRDDLRNRVWYKSRASEEPRSGHRREIPEDTYDLAINPVEEVGALLALLDGADDGRNVGDLLLEHPSALRATALVQNLADSPYALARVDYRDDELVPAYLIHVLNAFCFGLEKTLDVQRRTLRGLILENAPTREALGGAGERFWWAGGRR
ncbi:hypothetical protein GCM10023085_61280 [Actinomadura viridis]|uniref:Uncharacterized protein n=1 Tax=Actinomadura viridis TaxID=58110 RepID=A0A931GPB3_9ACTN|nr:hypothetical protein [Actinomadura viridis]MBG6090426.1 hypothetical protein [Actinomadura viridis]